ncbi:MAG: iron ABC transporter permease [Bacillota bacterium]|nr:iron ABC transporter permease [Bacillota bacterium]
MSRLKENDFFDDKRPRKILGILVLILFFAIFISLLLGRYGVPANETIRILLGQIFPIKESWTANMAISVINVRLPRVIMACLVGSSLALAGTAYQSVFQNPMAAPDILGASSGACFGAALGILLGLSSALIIVLAFGASLLSIILVYLVGTRTRGNQIVNILLAGIMIGSLFSAATSFVKLVADPTNQLPAITYWLMGSLSGTRMANVKFVLVPMFLGSLPILVSRWKMNILTLGEDEARSLGVNISRLRLVVILGATFVTAASVSVSGMIGWVGLVIPHLSRKLVGNDNRYLVPTSMVFGAIFLLLVDDISRNLLATEIPIGILTAFVGAPFFLYLMAGKGGRP